MLALLAAACASAACGPSNGGGTPANYVIKFTLSVADEDLSLLEFTVDYDNGNFTGSGAGVECELIDETSEAEATFSDDNAGRLTITIEADDEADELVEDEEFVQCNFVSAAQPTADDFEVEVTNAEPEDPDDVAVVVSSTDLGSIVAGVVTE
jgi:hypothetical protein